MSGAAPLFDACGVVELASRGKLEMSGLDAVGMLHKFCTNDILNLPVGRGCEAFVLDAKGHIQAYVLVHRLADRLLLEVLAGPADAEAAARLQKFLSRYVIVEKVEFVDRTRDLAELLIAGGDAAEIVQRALGIAAPTNLLEHVSCGICCEGAFLARSVQTTAPNFTLFCPADRATEAQQLLMKAGAAITNGGAYDAARIEAGLPLAGIDFADKALPQEIDRNERTLHFRKGCYLGQETVARIDALGHVNRTVTLLQFPGTAAAAPGLELRAGGQVVGTLTSAARMPDGSIAALGMVRTGHNQAGATLETDCGNAVVGKRAS